MKTTTNFIITAIKGQSVETAPGYWFMLYVDGVYTGAATAMDEAGAICKFWASQYLPA